MHVTGGKTFNLFVFFHFLYKLNLLNVVDGVKHNTAIDKVHKEEEKETESEHELYSKLTSFTLLFSKLR